MPDNDFDFDPYKACEAMKDEMDWQIKQWKKERMEEMYGCVKISAELQECTHLSAR